MVGWTVNILICIQMIELFTWYSLFSVMVNLFQWTDVVSVSLRSFFFLFDVQLVDCDSKLLIFKFFLSVFVLILDVTILCNNKKKFHISDQWTKWISLDRHTKKFTNKKKRHLIEHWIFCTQHNIFVHAFN